MSQKQIQKYAGLELCENSSGKYKGRPKISRRGEFCIRQWCYYLQGTMSFEQSISIM